MRRKATILWRITRIDLAMQLVRRNPYSIGSNIVFSWNNKSINDLVECIGGKRKCSREIFKDE